jgi:hypothetical protein
MRRIGETLETHDLKREPDFRSAWIDGLVSIRLVGQASGTHQMVPSTTDSAFVERADDAELDPPAEDPSPGAGLPCEESTAPVAESLNAPTGNAGVVEVPTATPESICTPGHDSQAATLFAASLSRAAPYQSPA